MARRILILALAGGLAASAIYPAAAQQATDTGSVEPAKGFGAWAEPVHVGGYVNARFSNPDSGAWTLQVRDLSLFLSADRGRWHFFSETELGEAATVSSDGLTTDNADVDLERLYVDYRGGPRWAVRAGKFLTPVGQWNLIHADPLVWSVSRPLTTSAAFARHATGLMLHGSRSEPDGTGVDYRVYVDATNALDPTERSERAFLDAPDDAFNPRNAFDWAIGAQFRYRTSGDRLQLGVSALRFRLDGAESDSSLLGADLLWMRGRTEMSAEAVYRDDVAGHEWGAFAQLVLPFSARWYGVGYLERYKPAQRDEALDLASIGLACQLRPAVRLKLERRNGRDNDAVAPDAWLASVALLF
jgi:hypothetical protein